MKTVIYSRSRSVWVFSSSVEHKW